MKTTRISVVIPVYNEAAFIGLCLESLHKQQRPADEIIVIDNNSTDKTADIARQYGAILVTEPRQGIAPAVVKGMNAAQGDIIARCDADSILPDDWLLKIEQRLASDEQAVGITGPGEFYGISNITGAFAQIWYMYAYFILVGSALAQWPLFGSNYAIRRSTWDLIRSKVHVNEKNIHDDMDFSIHLPVQSRIILMPSLKVGISARSLAAAGLKSRYAKGFRSLMMHWPEQAPWKRWAEKIR